MPSPEARGWPPAAGQERSGCLIQDNDKLSLAGRNEERHQPFQWCYTYVMLSTILRRLALIILQILAVALALLLAGVVVAGVLMVSALAMLAALVLVAYLELVHGRLRRRS